MILRTFQPQIRNTVNAVATLMAYSFAIGGFVLPVSADLSAPARFWISKSATQPIAAVLGTGGQLQIDLIPALGPGLIGEDVDLFIWAQPAKDVSGQFKSLQSLTLNIVTNSGRVDIHDNIVVENSVRFRSISDSYLPLSDPLNPNLNLKVQTFLPGEINSGNPDQTLNRYLEPGGLQASNPPFPGNLTGVGLGPTCDTACVQIPTIGPAWRLASFSVNALSSTGVDTLNLQIGAGGMNHMVTTGIENTSLTNVVFAPPGYNEAALNAGPGPSLGRNRSSEFAEIQFNITNQLLGDFNADGYVNGKDFLRWQRTPTIGSLADWRRNYGRSTLLPGGSGEIDGDYDEDGDVDGRDLLVWQRNPGIGVLADWQANYGYPGLMLTSDIVSAVPETSSVSLLIVSSILITVSRRRYAACLSQLIPDQELIRIAPVTTKDKVVSIFLSTKRITLSLVLVLLLSRVSHAAPNLTVTYDGLNLSGNHTWTAYVGPDPAFFHQTTSGFGGSLAVELAFAVRNSTFLSVTVNSTNWDFANPGLNPFSSPPGQVFCCGTWISPDNTLVFGAYGSPVFTSAGPFELFSFETQGSQLTTIDFGFAASGNNVWGATIAQRGQNFGGIGGTVQTVFFNGYSGSLTSELIPGDADGDGLVNGFDARAFSAALLDNTLLGYRISPAKTAALNFMSIFDFYTQGAPQGVTLIDFDDIPGFVQAMADSQLISLEAAHEVFSVAYEQTLNIQIPEPSSSIMALIAGPILMLISFRRIFHANSREAIG